MKKSNNEVSRQILSYLAEASPKAVKFHEIVNTLEIEERALFKNLFFLEENHLVQLMSSYPSGATYPTIHMVKMRDEGAALLHDEGKLESMFPLKGFSSRLDLYTINSLMLPEVLNILLVLIEKEEVAKGADKEKLLDDIKDLASAPGVSALTLGNLFEYYQP
ncbi:MAG: hypothetical protein RQ824_00085 [bacterium]|nr:hypothetical protein [bacterium]